MSGNVYYLPFAGRPNRTHAPARRTARPAGKPNRALQVPGGAPSMQQKRWLRRGLEQAGGKLPLFDEFGQRYSARTIKTCIEKGWAEPWFENPVKPDWLVCRLTDSGRKAIA